MSRKMMIAVMAGTIGLLADHLASARGGGAHGGLHAMPGAAVRGSNTGAAGTSSGNGAQTARPNIGLLTFGNGLGTASGPTIPSNVGASPAGVGGASPGSANGGGLNNLGSNPNGTGMTGASPPLPARTRREPRSRRACRHMADPIISLPSNPLTKRSSARPTRMA